MSHCAGNSDDWKQYYISCFVDHDMVMHYHWGLGIRHTYAHTTASTESQFHSTSQWSQPLHSSQHNMKDCGHVDDKINERDLTDSTQTELDFDLKFEPESKSDKKSESDSESILGDLVDMYGCPTKNALYEC
ncbi:hypothetical protein J3A83DRAFT_4198034 [Scleroderma citrinum]